MRRCARHRRAVHGRGDRRRGAAVRGKTEMDAVIAYLQGLGKHANGGTDDMDISGIVTGICWCCSSASSAGRWAWSPRRKADFDAARSLPLEDEEPE